MKNCDNVGQGRQFVDPADAEKAARGAYVDNAAHAPPTVLLPNAGPRAPQPEAIPDPSRATGG
jgi:hypothetical protein